jgi:hypothetical protein
MAVGNSPVFAKIKGNPEKEKCWGQLLNALSVSIADQERLADRRRALRQATADLLQKGHPVRVVWALLEERYAQIDKKGGA